MKKVYQKPQVEIVEFHSEEAIADGVELGNTSSNPWGDIELTALLDEEEGER